MRRISLVLAAIILVIGVASAPRFLHSKVTSGGDFVHFESGHVHPIAMTPDGNSTLFGRSGPTVVPGAAGGAGGAGATGRSSADAFPAANSTPTIRRKTDVAVRGVSLTVPSGCGDAADRDPQSKQV